MALNGVKDNKCFEPVENGVIKYTSSGTVTVAANGKNFVQFNDAAIANGTVAIASMTGQSTSAGDISITTRMNSDVLVVHFYNISDAEVTIPFNVMVL